MKPHSFSSTLFNLCLATLCAGIGAGPASAQSMNYVGGNYTENFDGMGQGTVTPANWFVGMGGQANGSTVVVSDGSDFPLPLAAAYNFGSISASDRALGSIAASGDRNIEVRIRNDTVREIDSFTVRYDGEQWRIGTMTSASTLTLRYSVDGVNFANMGSGFDFTSPRAAIPSLLENVAVDGNAPLNRVAGIGGTYVPVSPVPSGATIYLRWVDADDAGSDPGLAVDNFSFSAPAVAGPPLAIRNNLNGSVTISWEFPATGFLLESKPDLAASDWTLVTGGVDVPNEGRHNVTVSTSASSARYFRLRNPVPTP